ncbi:MAG TPA: GNAT family N-acetyltransferase [Acidimicrobiales bacterium]|nr:GNAT family N-acetyltransferase [Acidimicrobiales bacterium]
MRIQEFDVQAASEDELRALYEFGLPLSLELDPETPPDPFELWRRQMLITSPFGETRRWVAHDGDAVVGYGNLQLTRTGDNTHLAEFDVEVAASHRRRGLGCEILRRIVDDAEADGRTTLVGGAPKDSVGTAFLAAVGCEPAIVDRRSRLRLAEVDPSLVEGWLADAKAKASDYSLLLFDGRVPDEHLEAMISVLEVMNDAPRENLEMDDEHETPEQFRDGERRIAERGGVLLQLVARHDPTGEFAGFTTLSFNPLVPQVVWQWGTAVRREHRGHAIGRWLKAANLNNLREHNPSAEFVDTWNAGSNKWMLAINDDLGFRPYIWYAAMQGKIDDVKKALG